MRLDQLLQGVDVLAVQGDVGVEITGVTYDSRQVEPGYCMVAYPGFVQDGHDYLPQAASRGAVAAVVERLEAVPAGMTGVRVAAARPVLAQLAANFYGHPSHRLGVVAVTGTNGKTTTTYMLRSILTHLAPTGLIGTVQTIAAGEAAPTQRTTPEASDLQRLLARMVAGGDRFVVMEAASQALALHRLDETAVDIAIFTNLTQDHLGDPKTGAHRDMEEYFAAKALLFHGLVSGRKKSGKQYPLAAIINADDAYGQRLLNMVACQTITYGIEREADYRADNITLGASGAEFDVVYPGGQQHIHLALPGRFNVLNALAAFAAAQLLGAPSEALAEGLARATVPGRFEPVRAGQPFGVVVDYAHTPDGLENVLRAARELTSGKLIVVFGAGGDRDRTKRPKMGRVASELADVVVLTSDNPRSEDPERILDDIVAGCDASRELKREVNRSRAIDLAISLAKAGDMVVIAGKGHETYQIFRDRTIAFDDREVARQALQRHGFGGEG